MHTQEAQEIPLTANASVTHACMVYMSTCEQCCSVDYAIIPYHLKCIMRSSEVPLTSLCLMASVNFSQLYS